MFNLNYFFKVKDWLRLNMVIRLVPNPLGLVSSPEEEIQTQAQKEGREDTG